MDIGPLDERTAGVVEAIELWSRFSGRVAEASSLMAFALMRKRIEVAPPPTRLRAPHKGNAAWLRNQIYELTERVDVLIETLHVARDIALQEDFCVRRAVAVLAKDSIASAHLERLTDLDPEHAFPEIANYLRCSSQLIALNMRLFADGLDLDEAERMVAAPSEVCR